MKIHFGILALALVAFAAPAHAQVAVANVVQVTSFGNNTSVVSQSARNAAVASVTQATIRGNNTSVVAQRSRIMAVNVAQGTFRGNNVSVISQHAWRRR